MTIKHNIASTVRRPGQFHEFDLTSSAQGLTPLANRVLLVGMMTSAGTATADEFVQVFDELTSDAAFGKGSELALMVRKAFETGRRLGFQPEIWACPVAAPGGGTAAVFKITTSAGTAAAGGDIEFRIGEATFRAGVSAGDDQDAVALAIKAAIDAKLEQVPVTAAINGSNANEVDLTFNYASENGSDLKVLIDDVGLTGLTVASSNPTPGAGAAAIATALSNSLAKFFEVVAVANHQSEDVTALDAHLDSAWAPDAKRWRFTVMAENGTLSAANTLSAAANDYRQVIASYENSPAMPGLIAAAIATAISAREQANYNWDGEELPLAAPPDASVYTTAELESALAAGTTPLQPNDARDQSFIVRLITTKTTEGGNPFERAKDLATIRGLVYTTRQLEASFSQKFKAVNKSALVKRRMRSVAYNVLISLEEIGVTQNVDELFDQLLVEDDPIVATRAVVSVPESIIPNLHQIVLKHVLFVE